ncbi:MAG: GAF domain-containing protein, partial [Methanobacteriota archaeon]
MIRDSTVTDPAVSIMTMDIIGQVLARSDNPKELGRYLSEEIRELTGARCVLLVRGSDVPDGAGRQILTVHPERRRLWAESPEVFHCFASHLGDMEPSVWYDGDTGSPPEVIRNEGFETCIIIPLITGNAHVGVIFALGLPDIIHLDSVISLLDTLSAIIALVLRNSSLYEYQEQIIETRTSELQAAYEEIRSELDERKKIESILQSTNAYLENLITCANVPIVVWDP